VSEGVHSGTGRDPIRVLLCGDRVSGRLSLLAEIMLREVLDVDADPSLARVCPEELSRRGTVFVLLDELVGASIETSPDVVLVLGDEADVGHARWMLSRVVPRPEVIGITRGGHALLNLSPKALRDLILFAASSRRAQAPHGGSTWNVEPG
jgi:NAD kinase